MSAPPVSPTDAAVRRASIDADASTATSSDRWLVLRHGGRDTDRWRVLFAFASYLDASARYQAERHNLRMGELALVHLRAPDGDATMVLRDSMGTGGARAVARARGAR